jgi:hypothetical protein
VDLCNVFRLRYKRPATQLHAAEFVLFLEATKGDTVLGMTIIFDLEPTLQVPSVF